MSKPARLQYFQFKSIERLIHEISLIASCCSICYQAALNVLKLSGGVKMRAVILKDCSLPDDSPSRRQSSEHLFLPEPFYFDCLMAFRVESDICVAIKMEEIIFCFRLMREPDKISGCDRQPSEVKKMIHNPRPLALTLTTLVALLALNHKAQARRKARCSPATSSDISTGGKTKEGG